MLLEALSCAVLLAVACWGLAARCGVSRHWTLLGALAAFLLFVLAGSARLQAVYSAAVKAAHRPVEVHENGYVGSQSCRTCHPSEHASWHASHHRTMTQLPTPESVLAPFEKVTLEHGTTRYELDRRGDEFWVRFDSPNPQSGEGVVERRIVLTTGAHHQQDYWFELGQDREMGKLPFSFRVQEQRWYPDNSMFVTPPDSPLGSGHWNSSCITCHTTNGNPNYVSATQIESFVAEFGIACEACHGPGQRHVAANRSPGRRYQFHFDDREDPTIVNPKRLGSKRATEVCGQCHGIHYTDEQQFARLMTRGPDYRPGDDLLAMRSYTNDPTDTSSFWPDGMVRVSGREFNGLLKTPCYQQGDMSCLSCHRLHQDQADKRSSDEWADDQLAVEMQGNAACVQCHRDLADAEKLVRHTHHDVNSTGSQCYNCHMPYTTYGLLKAIRSHQIDSPNVQSSLDTSRPNACNQCHLDRTLAWAGNQLATWYGHDVPKFSADETEIAASVLWTLRGDAGQRALMAWSMGWPDAQQASGTEWLAPYLAELLRDPYDAVRFIAHRSLRTLPEYADLEFDIVAPSELRDAVASQVVDAWNNQMAGHSTAKPAVLVNQQGGWQDETVERLLEQRDHRPVNLAE